MSDFLLNPNARRVIQALGLPLPIPQHLARAKGPLAERELEDRAIAVAGGGGFLANMLAQNGANVIVIGDQLGAFAAAGEAYGRPARLEVPEKIHGFVIDATGLADPGALRALHTWVHALAPTLAKNGRAVIVGRPAGGKPVAAAARAALDGFTRSLAKELGKRGATANLVTIEEGAEDRAAPVVRFLLSQRSAFISAQPFHVTRLAKGAASSTTRPLDGKVALVTGAARGIGEATARALAAEGARVVCLDRPEDAAALAQVARAIHGTTLTADIASAEAPAEIAKHGPFDIVVHNAGVTRDRTIAKMPPELWEQAIEVNLAAVTRITAALTLRDGARVICLSSVAGIAGNLGQTNYAASKAGLIGYVRALAPELAPRGITVNAIAPGFIETRMTAAIPMMIREAGRRLSALGQGGLPEDVAQAIAFLSQPAAVGLTGQLVRVCGGALIGA